MHTIWCMQSCMVSGILCTISGIWYLVYVIWCMVSGIWCMVSGIWYLLYLVSGTWYLAYGIWYLVSTVYVLRIEISLKSYSPSVKYKSSAKQQLLVYPEHRLQNTTKDATSEMIVRNLFSAFLTFRVPCNPKLVDFCA